MTHAGEDIGLPEPIHCRPEHVLKVLEETQSDKLILAHMGGWRLWKDVKKYLAGAPVYFDTAFSGDHVEVAGMLSKKDFVELVRCHEADKILFGTDSPWSTPLESLEWIRQTELTEEEKRKILGENMTKILQF